MLEFAIVPAPIFIHHKNRLSVYIIHVEIEKDKKWGGQL